MSNILFLEKGKINIATPVVWAGAGTINQFAKNMNRLIDALNETAQRHKKIFEVEKAVIDVHSVTQDKLLNCFENVDVKCFNTSKKIREKNGMAHWWFTCVQRAFYISSSVRSVLYYPIDACWDDTSENTVANPIRLCGMLKLLSQNDSELLVVGNYRGTNANKEQIEEAVRNILRNKYPELDKKVIRVRSEYWGISRELYGNFEKEYFKNHRFPNAADPTLLLILYCLRKKKTIIPYDLGSYKVEGKWDDEMIRSQIKRARTLIDDFVNS